MGMITEQQARFFRLLTFTFIGRLFHNILCGAYKLMSYERISLQFKGNKLKVASRKNCNEKVILCSRQYPFNASTFILLHRQCNY